MSQEPQHGRHAAPQHGDGPQGGHSAPAEPTMTSVLANHNPKTTSVPPPGPGDGGAGVGDPATESVAASGSVETSEGSESPLGSAAASGPGSVPGSVPGSAPQSGAGSGPGTGGAFPRASRRTSARRSRRGRLGAGLVEVPPVPYSDPTSVVLTDPVVSEEKRFCGGCGAKVGRSAENRRGAAEGVCDNCGTAFSFVPKLRPKEIVSGQYEVLGALAYGGLGWIYLATDRNVSDRWVVLKGLINSGDEMATTAALNETRFLAEVEHPNIVKIHNFVEHPDPLTGNMDGYIVMEYVGGQSLRQLALEHHKKSAQAEPLPIGQVIAYGLEILPALGYLHNQQLLYCDLKPDNVIQTNEQLKLIDLGAVRRIDDYDTSLFFTSGYSAPELSSQGASVQSDLYTVGRTLAVLSFEFTGYTTKYRNSLPGPDEVALFRLFDSYYRFLKRATHDDPDRRFLSAEDMADQLRGVLHEVMALGTGSPKPGASAVFGPEVRTFGVQQVVPERAGENIPQPDPVEVVAGLPVPQIDTDDPAAGMLAVLAASDPHEAIDALSGAPRESIEVRLRAVRARIELGERSEANRQLQAAQYLAIKAGFPHNWRIDWYRGLIELAGGRPKVAHAAFDTVYDDLPGEIAPKLALGVSAESVHDYFGAARYYEMVWRTDHSYVSAAFGLARVYLAQGARDGAIEVLDSVPQGSTHHTAAQVAAIRIKTRIPGGGSAASMQQPDVIDAANRLERLPVEAERGDQLAIEVLESTRDWLNTAGGAGYVPQDGTRVLGCALTDRELRFGLETRYRALARRAGAEERRIQLVDRANAVRPRTLK